VDGCVGGGYCLPRCLVTVVLKCGLLSFGQGIFPFGPVLGPTWASFVSDNDETMINSTYLIAFLL